MAVARPLPSMERTSGFDAVQAAWAVTSSLAPSEWIAVKVTFMIVPGATDIALVTRLGVPAAIKMLTTVFGVAAAAGAVGEFLFPHATAVAITAAAISHFFIVVLQR